MPLREFLSYVMDDEIIEVKINVYGREFATFRPAVDIELFDPELLEKNVILIESGINRIVVTVR